MTIRLMNQRPPLKRMGRRQRTGSKSNPRTGVQWANWMDVPGSGGAGGSTGPGDPYITSLAPNTLAASAGATTITVHGARFQSGCEIEFDNVPVATTFVSATSITTSFDPTAAATISVSVRNPNAEESNNLTLTVTAGAEAMSATPSSSWLKGEIIEWLTTEGGYEEEGLSDYTKAELLDLVEE